jgi:hypothetical protein
MSALLCLQIWATARKHFFSSTWLNDWLLLKAGFALPSAALSPSNKHLAAQAIEAQLFENRFFYYLFLLCQPLKTLIGAETSMHCFLESNNCFPTNSETYFAHLQQTWQENDVSATFKQYFLAAQWGLVFWFTQCFKLYVSHWPRYWGCTSLFLNLKGNFVYL